MDLVAGVRKEGSRGGRDSFKWADVQDSAHRENYLGHSLMAPVGRWQKNRDLSWYAKGDAGEDEEQKAREARLEEIRRVKEAEQEALAKALGFAPTPKALGPGAGTGANSMPVSGREVERAVQQAVAEEGGQDGKGVGFGLYGGGEKRVDQDEVLEGSGMPRPTSRRTEDRPRERRRRSRSRDKHGDQERRHRHDEHRSRDDRRRRSRSRDRDRERRRRSRSRIRDRRRYERDDKDCGRRSYSPPPRTSTHHREEYRDRRR